MVAEWRTVPLGEVITFQRGFDLPIQDRLPGSVPIVSSSGITGNHREARVSGPGVVTGRYGTIGEIFYIAEDFWPLNTTLFVKDFKGNHPRFITYLLQTVDFMAHSDKSSVPGVNRNHLHMVRVRVPSLPEQQALAGVLGALDDKIELNRRMNETLEAMAGAIFTSWFVDFDPVRAKHEESSPGYTTAEVVGRFPNSFEESAMGRVPTGWKVVPLPDVMEINPRRNLSGGQVAPYLDMQHMPTSGHRPTAWVDRPFGSGTKFVNGDTLLARITPCLENGKTAFVDFLADGQVGWGSTEFIVMRPNPLLPPEYGYYLARSDDLRAHAIQNMTGSSGRQRVPANCFEQYLIAVPPPAVARHFGEVVRPFMAAIRCNSKQSDTFRAIRDALLPKLLSGEIRVKGAEKAMEAAL